MKMRAREENRPQRHREHRERGKRRSFSFSGGEPKKKEALPAILVRHFQFRRPEGPASVLAQGNALGEREHKTCSLKDCKIQMRTFLQSFRLHISFATLPRALPWAKTLAGPSGLKKKTSFFSALMKFCPPFARVLE
jgi:hypothetical protein